MIKCALIISLAPSPVFTKQDMAHQENVSSVSFTVELQEKYFIMFFLLHLTYYLDSKRLLFLLFF